jgi:hypothetical protein
MVRTTVNRRSMGVDYAHGHLRSGVPVVGTHGAALVLTAATCGLVAHQLVDDPRRDAGVLSQVA